MTKQSDQSGFSVIEVGIVIVVVALIGLIGWRVYEANFKNTQQNHSTAERSAELNDEILVSNLADIASLEDITASAVEDKPGVRVIHVELEMRDGNLVYKAQRSDGVVVVFNARTGAKVKTETDTELTSEQLPVDFASGIGFARALEIAKAEKPESKVYKIELELENGVLVYSVRFTDKARVDVNVQDGTIVRTKAARPDKSADKRNDSGERAADDNPSASDRSRGSGSSSGSSGSDDSDRRQGSSDDDDKLSRNDDDDDIDDRDDRDDDNGGDRDRTDDDRSGRDDDSSNSGSGSDDRR